MGREQTGTTKEIQIVIKMKTYQRRKTRRKQRGRGITRSKAIHSWVYSPDTGEIDPLYETLNDGTPFFRKEDPYDIEQHIASILMKHPHPNIVKIYNVSPEKIDMELVKDIRNIRTIDWKQLESAKEHLQNLGIAYIDWKVGNMGIGSDGKFKVFDFNGSAFYSSNTFTEGPGFVGYRYKNAINKGYTKPKNINNSSFHAMVSNPLS